MKNKINVVLGLSMVTALVLGFANFASASTYQYVNASGQLSSVIANSPQEAMAEASSLGFHSGVMLVSNSTNTIKTNQVVTDNDYITGQGSNVYLYINSSGQLSSVRANSAQEAIVTATALGLHSGVMLK